MLHRNHEGRRPLHRSRGPLLLRVLAALACALSVAVLSLPALAALTFGPATDRTAPPGELPERTQETRYWISKKDCLEETQYRFALQGYAQTGTATNFELWVSANVTVDCTDPQFQAGANQQCYRVTTPKDGTISNEFRNDPNVRVTARDIATALSGLDGVDADCNDLSGTTQGRPLMLWFMEVTPGNPAATNSGKFEKITLDLLPPSPPADITVTTAEQSLTVELVNPPTVDVFGYYLYCDPPPIAGAGSGAGCGCLNTGETGAGGSGAGSTSTSTTTSSSSTGAGSTSGAGGGMSGTGGMGMAGTGGTGGMGMAGTGGTGGMGMAGAGGTGGMGMAGTGGTGGMGMSGAGGAGGMGMSGGMSGAGGAGGRAMGQGGGGAAGGTMETGEACSCGCSLNEGDPAPGAGALCGEIAQNGTVGVASVLENNVPYGVAVVAYDKVGNVSNLSVARCAEPVEIQDFYEDYREKGGQAGGGICSIQRGNRPLGAAGPLLGALAGLSLLLRRRRRASRRAGGAR